MLYARVKWPWQNALAREQLFKACFNHVSIGFPSIFALDFFEELRKESDELVMTDSGSGSSGVTFFLEAMEDNCFDCLHLFKYPILKGI